MSDALPFGRLWYKGPNAVSNAIGYAEHYSRSHHAVIRVYNGAGNVIETYGAQSKTTITWPNDGLSTRCLSNEHINYA